MNALLTKAFAVLLLASLLVFGGCRWQAKLDAGALADMALAAAKEKNAALASQVMASEAAREQEQIKAKAANEAAAAYEQGKRDAEAAADAVVAGLRAGTERLRRQWRGCEADRLPTPAGTPGEPDAAADHRIEGAGDLVRAAAQCDAQVIGLQDFIRSERQ